METQTIEEEKPQFVPTLDKLTLKDEWSHIPNLKTYLVWQKNEMTGKFEKTNYQQIRYNGRFVNYMSTLYKVLPNEDVLRTADMVAKRLDYKKATPIVKSQNTNGWCKPAGHVISNPEKTQMIAHYQIGKPVDLTGGGDKWELWLAVANNIDGKGGAFKVMPVTKRLSCDNVAYHILDTQVLHKGNEKPQGAWFNKDSTKLEQTESLKEAWKMIDDAKKNFQRVSYKKPHFQTLTLEYVTHAILTVVEQGEELLTRLREMYQLKLQQLEAEKIVKQLPKSITTDLIWLDIDKKSGEVTFKEGTSQMTAFNDITNRLTFGQKRSWSGTLHAYKKLDEILVRNR